MPTRIPEPRGQSVNTTAFVDASHAANKVTRRSHTGFIFFVNVSTVIWFSKRQNTVESSTFSLEFIAMKACVESIQALTFKLCMFGVPIDDATTHHLTSWYEIELCFLLSIDSTLVELVTTLLLSHNFCVASSIGTPNMHNLNVSA